MPLVAVVLPVRNRATMVGDAIASVLAQTQHDFALIVVDDGSTDGSAAAASRALTAPSAAALTATSAPARAVAAVSSGARVVGLPLGTAPALSPVEGRVLRRSWRGVANARNAGAAVIDSRW